MSYQPRGCGFVLFSTSSLPHDSCVVHRMAQGVVLYPCPGPWRLSALPAAQPVDKTFDAPPSFFMLLPQGSVHNRSRSHELIWWFCEFRVIDSCTKDCPIDLLILYFIKANMFHMCDFPDDHIFMFHVAFIATGQWDRNWNTTRLVIYFPMNISAADVAGMCGPCSCVLIHFSHWC